MIIVPLKEGENIERALKKFKRKFDVTVLSELKQFISRAYSRLKSNFFLVRLVFFKRKPYIGFVFKNTIWKLMIFLLIYAM